MIEIGGRATTRGFSEYVWLVLADPVWLANEPRWSRVDYEHRYLGNYAWQFRNWHAVPKEQQVHNREELYMQLWEHTDRLGILQKTQLELAEIIGIPYQRLSLICSEYQKAGYVKKYRHKFQMKNPDRITAEDWADFMAVRKGA